MPSPQIIAPGTPLSLFPGMMQPTILNPVLPNNSVGMEVIGNNPWSGMGGIITQPTFITSGLPTNLGVTNTGGFVAQPFTMFVNGAPPQPTNAVNISPSDHPCQGKGGSECGCGGTCTENVPTKTQVELEQSVFSKKDVKSQFTPIGNAFRRNDFQIKMDQNTQEIKIYPNDETATVSNLSIDLPKPGQSGQPLQSLDTSKIGNSFTTVCQYPNGITEYITAKVTTAYNVNVKIIDITQSRTILEIDFQRDVDGWFVGNNRPGLSLKTNLFQFAIGSWIAQYELKSVAVKTQKINYEENSTYISPSQPPSPYGVPPPHILPFEPPCSGHDLICTWGSLLDNFVLPVGFPLPFFVNLDSNNKEGSRQVKQILFTVTC